MHAMKLGLLSTSYKHTAIEQREKLAVSYDRIPSLIAFLKQDCRLEEVMVLSTCNRVELAYIHSNPILKKEEILKCFHQFLDLNEDHRGDFIFMEGDEAVRHFFRVSASLESLVIGEPQILGQVKDAYHAACTAGGCGPYLNRIAHHAFSSSKKIRSETGIAKYAVSISYTAVELAKKIFDDLSDKVILLIGAGEMSELAASHLMKAGINHIMVANRTFSNAVRLAEKFHGSAVPFEAVDLHMENADIVISSTGAKGYVVTEKMVQKCMIKRKHKSVFFVDIAVPRDIDPEVNDISNAYLYDIDDLQTVVDSNKQQREQEAEQALRFVEAELELFRSWTATLPVVPAIKALKGKFQDVMESTMEQNTRWQKGLDVEQKKAVQQLMNAYTNKLLHQPLLKLRENSESGAQDFLHLLKELFSLEIEQDKQQSSPSKIISIHEKKN